MASVDIVKFILGLVYPRRCFSCGKNGAYFCLNCLQDLEEPPLFFPSCLDGLIVAGSIQNKALFKAIKFLKYYGAKDVAFDLGGLLSLKVKEKLPDCKTNAILTPIPLSRQRERERGFNQAELLARVVSENLGISLRTDLLKKIRETKPQTKTNSKRERFENIRDSFEARFNPVLENSRVILVDDIMTTGATMAEAAKALKKAGAKIVIGLVVAKGA